MQKFHRFDHKPHLATALAPLRELVGTTVKFTKFVIEASQLLGSVERKPQARELLDLLEKRMLDLRVCPQWFRELVQKYSWTRLELGFGKSSSPENLQKLDWYRTNFTGDYELLLKLDSLSRFSTYFYTQSVDSPAKFRDFTRAVERDLECKSVVCYNRKVIYGSNDSNGDAESHWQIMERLFALAECKGIHFDANATQLYLKALRIDRFVFSEEGAVRDA